MNTKVRSIRPFIGSSNYQASQAFYRTLGFEETNLLPKMSVYKMQDFSFYLQDAFVKDWVDNTMVFMEVENVQDFYSYLISLELASKFPGVRLEAIRYNDWGNECFLHDPSGVLWHFGQFN